MDVHTGLHCLRHNTHTHTHTHTHTVHLDAGTESFVIEQHTHTLSAEMSVCVQTSESRHPNQDIRIKTFESRHPNQDIRIKTSESRHPNQDIRIKTPESRHQNQDIRIKTSESGHPNQDIKSSLLPVSPQMELMGTAKGLLANSLRSRHKGLHCLRPRRKCNQNWSKTAEFGWKQPNEDIRIKTSESRHPNQDIRIKTSESRHQNQDIRIKTSESRHPNQDIKSSLLPARVSMPWCGVGSKVDRKNLLTHCVLGIGGYIAWGQGENAIKTGPKQANSAENSRIRLVWTSFDWIFRK
jgi:hypothetical protein